GEGNSGRRPHRRPREPLVHVWMGRSIGGRRAALCAQRRSYRSHSSFGNSRQSDLRRAEAESADGVCEHFHLFGISQRRRRAASLAMRFRYGIVALICGAVTINYLDRALLGVALPSLQQEFGLQATLAGV